MANKALSKRQKLMIRAEPARNSLKPRNPFSLAAGQRAAGAHRKAASSLRHLQKLAARKALDEGEDK